MQIISQSLSSTHHVQGCMHRDCFTICHKQNIPKAACRLFHRVCHQHTMFRAACTEIVSQSATNTTCPGLHADCCIESATNITCLGLHADCFTESTIKRTCPGLHVNWLASCQMGQCHRLSCVGISFRSLQYSYVTKWMYLLCVSCNSHCLLSVRFHCEEL